MRLLCVINGNGVFLCHFVPWFFRNATESQVDPLLAFAFVQTFIDIIQEYFGTVSVATVKENFEIVYQVRNPIFLSDMVSLVYRLQASRRNLGFGRVPINDIAQHTKRYRVASFTLQQTPQCGWRQFQFQDQSRFCCFRTFLVDHTVAESWSTICK